MNNLIINIEKKEMKGYCKAKDFKEQFRKLKEMLDIEE